MTELELQKQYDNAAWIIAESHRILDAAGVNGEAGMPLVDRISQICSVKPVAQEWTCVSVGGVNLQLRVDNMRLI